MIDYISGLVRCNYKYLLKHNLLYNKYIMTVDCNPNKTYKQITLCKLEFLCHNNNWQYSVGTHPPTTYI